MDRSGLFKEAVLVLETTAARKLRNPKILRAIRRGRVTADDLFKRALHDILLEGASSADHIAPIYDELLALHPVIDLGTRRFQLRNGRGHQRKISGSYYTPPELIDELIHSSLDPIVERSLERFGNGGEAIRSISILDPSCGTGRFLDRAVLHLCSHLARLTGRAPEECRAEILRGCIYGIDSDPLAIALAKKALPEANIIVGDSIRESPKGLFGRSGFDCIIGNPPWEQSEVKEKEWAGKHLPELLSLTRGSDRKDALSRLRSSNLLLHQELERRKRSCSELSRYAAECGKFPLTARGRINLYSLFVELGLNELTSGGRLAMIVPTGIATDRNNSSFFAELIDSCRIVSLHDFENRARLFPGVDSRFRFCLLTLNAGGGVPRPAFSFFNQRPEDIGAKDCIRISAAQIRRFNPTTRTLPIFRTRTDLTIFKKIYSHAPVFIGRRRNDWHAELQQGMFNMTSHSGLFRRREELERQGLRLRGNTFPGFVPLFEAKMIHLFNPCWATFDRDGFRRPARTELSARTCTVIPRFWVERAQFRDSLRFGWKRPWLLAYRGISNPTNERTLIASLLPICAVGNSLSLIWLNEAWIESVHCLLANLASLAADYVVRAKMGGTNINFHVMEQLPIFPPNYYEATCPWSPAKLLKVFIKERTARLLPFFSGSDVGSACISRDGVEAARSELDACFFHLYGLTRREASAVLDTFGVLRRNEERRVGEFRTKRLVLDAYDALNR